MLHHAWWPSPPDNYNVSKLLFRASVLHESSRSAFYERLRGVHPLRAAAAFQLAAALLWSQGETRGHYFVSFDQRLREAAGKEGFSVLPE